MRVLVLLAFIAWGAPAFSQWDGAGGEAGSKAIHRNDVRIERWAETVDISRGWYDITDKDSGRVEGGIEANVYGQADNYTLSLGDSGVATVSFNQAIRNISGPDFVIFENGFAWFSGYFLELAFVEVSTDGKRFVRFPAQTIADTSVQYTNNAAMDPADYHNLAGKHQAPYGTPFDLEELADSSGISIDSIHYIRLIDVVGIIDSALASRDVNGRIINDPWPTPFGTGGFDLDAVGVLGTTTTYAGNEVVHQSTLYPNPVSTGQDIHWNGDEAISAVRIIEMASGKVVYRVTPGKSPSSSIWRPETSGVYLVELSFNDQIIRKKVCVTD